MNTIQIRLNNFEDVRRFVQDCTGIPEDMELVSGSVTADPKSIMGMMAMDFSRPMELRYSGRERIPDALKEYRV